MFSFLQSSSNGQSLFLQLQGSAWWLLKLMFLVVWSDIYHILCATAAYLHIILIENFMKLVQRWKVHIYQLKELLCNIRNDCLSIRQVNPNVTVALSFYMTCVQLLEWKTDVTVTLSFKSRPCPPLNALRRCIRCILH